MRVLAFDTASPRPALALVDTGDGTLPLETVEPLAAAAAESLAGRLAALENRARIPARSVDRVAVLSGPGSFTGLRAGTAFARGFSRALGVPLISVSTFAAASHARPEPPDLDFLLDAGRGDVHRARRRAGRIEERAPLPAPLPRRRALEEAAIDSVAVADLSEEPLVLALSLAALASRGDAEPADSTPRYGRASAAEEKLEPKR